MCSCPAYLPEVADDELRKSIGVVVVAVELLVALQVGRFVAFEVPEADMEFLVGEQVFEVDCFPDRPVEVVGQELFQFGSGIGDGLFGFDEGEFVESGPDILATAFSDEEGVAVAEEEIMEIPFADLGLLAFDGEIAGFAIYISMTGHGEWTGVAVGVGGFAEKGSHFHHRLVMFGGMLGVEELGGEGGKGFLPFGGVDGCIDAGKAGQETVHIAIYHGVREIEGEGGDGSSGIVAHTFQGFDGVVVGRETGIKFRHHLFCSRLQIPGAGIIAQTLPEP